MIPCARLYIHMIGEPAYVCERSAGHDETCYGRARCRSGEVVPGRAAHWPRDHSYRVAGEYIRRPELLDAADEAAA